MDTLSDRFIRGSGTPEARWLAWLGGNSLRRANARDLVEPGGTLHVVAPHPDDEVLGCGGIMREAFLAGVPLRVWAITDGERSHPGSPSWPPAALVRERARESARALALIAPGTPSQRLGVPDGRVQHFEDDVAGRLSVSLRAADTVVAPWLWDGHPDHEASSRAAFRAAHARGCRFLEVPIWAWHWMEPDSAAFPADRASAVSLKDETIAIRRRAVACFRTQLEPDPHMGKPPVLTQAMLDRLARRFEVIFQ